MAHSKSARKLRVAVIGAGMAGILTAIRLKEAGYDFAVYVHTVCGANRSAETRSVRSPLM